MPPTAPDGGGPAARTISAEMPNSPFRHLPGIVMGIAWREIANHSTGPSAASRLHRVHSAKIRLARKLRLVGLRLGRNNAQDFVRLLPPNIEPALSV